MLLGTIPHPAIMAVSARVPLSMYARPLKAVDISIIIMNW